MTIRSGQPRAVGIRCRLFLAVLVLVPCQNLIDGLSYVATARVPLALPVPMRSHWENTGRASGTRTCHSEFDKALERVKFNCSGFEACIAFLNALADAAAKRDRV